MNSKTIKVKNNERNTVFMTDKNGAAHYSRYPDRFTIIEDSNVINSVTEILNNVKNSKKIKEDGKDN